jgi:hypothetical protein
MNCMTLHTDNTDWTDINGFILLRTIRMSLTRAVLVTIL